jgi:hypothetical protein
VRYSPLHHRISAQDLAKIAAIGLTLLLTIGFFAWFLPSIFMGVFTPVRTALATVNNVTAESGEVVRIAANLIGTQLKATIKSLGEDEVQVQETVLHVTKVASILASKHLNRTAKPILGAVDGVSILAGDFLELASAEIRQSCWLVACLFLPKQKCDEQFYTEFHLCDAPVYNVTEGGVNYQVSAPCEFHGKYIKTDATERYNTYVRTRVFGTFEEKIKQLNEDGLHTYQAFMQAAKEKNIYSHLYAIAKEECSSLKPYMQRDCYENHCIESAAPRSIVDQEKVTYACLQHKWAETRKMFEF